MKSKSKQPLVSVLIPVFNGTTLLDKAITSVLKSSYQNLEVLLVDDGSTDQSRKKCLEYQRKYSNIHFFGFRKNRGMTRCLNFGIKKAKGKYIARLNQDDQMTPDRIKKQVTFLEKNHDHVVVGGAIQLISDQGKKIEKVSFPKTDKLIREQWLFLSPYSDPTVMYRKSAWMKTEGYSQYFWPADDVHMWYQLGQQGKLANLAQVLTLVGWNKKCGSIKIHRRQMIKTWQVHQWASEFISRPTLALRIFWLGQLFAGYLFPPEFNWWVYRQLRKIELFIFSLRKFSAQPMTLRKRFFPRIAVSFSR